MGYLDFIPRLLAPAPPVVPPPPSPRPAAAAETDETDGTDDTGGTEGNGGTAAESGAAEAPEVRGVWRDLESVISAFFTSFFPTIPAGLEDDDDGVPAAAGFGAM